MRQLALCIVAGLLAAPCIASAQGSGAWQTFLRAYSYEGLVANADTVWCATGEAGLILFDRATRSFTPVTREPGGLASNALTAIAFDRPGNLWLGTTAVGASRLSPSGQWALVNVFDGLPSEEVTVLEADPASDSLWIGTKGGIALWDGGEIAGALPDGVNPSPFLSDDIRGIVVRADSQFIATALGMHLRRPLGGATAVDTINAGLAGTIIDDLASDGTSVLCLANGVAHRFDFTTGGWSPTAPIGTVRRLQDDGATIYASTNQGVYRWSGAAWVLVDATLTSASGSANIFSVTGDGVGGVVAANLNGVYEVPPGGGPPALSSPNQPPGNNMLNVYVDGPRVYVNTLDEGVGRLEAGAWRNWFPLPMDCQAGCDTTFRNPLFAFALLVGRDGRKWVACWGRTMEIFDDSVSPNAFSRPTYNDALDQARHTFAAAGAVDTLGGHWFGMDTPDLGNPALAPIGLDYYDTLGNHVATFRPDSIPSMLGNGKIKALTVDKTGRIWIGHSGEGIQYFRWAPGDPTPMFFNVSTPQNIDVRGLVASGDTIWAATTSDLRSYNRVTAAWHGNELTIPAGPAQLALHPLAVATNGTVWLGTVNGVRVYARDGTILTDYNKSNSPLAEDEVRAIRVDPATGAIWIATAGGLNRFDPFYVAPPPPVLPRLEIRVHPNPSFLTGIGVSLHITGNTSTYVGAVYDISGRKIRRVGAVDGGIIWDGRDRDGRLVEPGVYFLRVEGGGRDAVARVVLLR